MTLPSAATRVEVSAAELRRGSSAVRVRVAPGAPILAFEVEGHDWCELGPWQDYAPTAGACALPTFVAGAPGATFPEGGVLAAEEPTVDVRADGAGGSITAWWAPSPFPLGWTRVVSLDADGALCLRYMVTNAQRAPLPFVWGLPIPLPWSAATLVDLPRGARSRVEQTFGEGLPAAGSEFAWPALRDGGRLVDLTHPAQLGTRRAVLCYVELPRARFALCVGDRVLEVTGDAGMLTHARVWISHDADGGPTGRRWWRRRESRRAISVGPAVGAPGRLSDAVGAWRTARWVEPGETIRWDVRLRSMSAPAESSSGPSGA